MMQEERLQKIISQAGIASRRAAEKMILEGQKEVAFIIGGPMGLAPEVLERAGCRLSFSKMTFPHQMIRIFLLEQIYRSYKIMKGEVYHK